MKQLEEKIEKQVRKAEKWLMRRVNIPEYCLEWHQKELIDLIQSDHQRIKDEIEKKMKKIDLDVYSKMAYPSYSKGIEKGFNQGLQVAKELI